MVARDDEGAGGLADAEWLLGHRPMLGRCVPSGTVQLDGPPGDHHEGHCGSISHDPVHPTVHIAEPSAQRITRHDAVTHLVRDDDDRCGAAGEVGREAIRLGFDVLTGMIGHGPVRHPEREAIEEDRPVERNGGNGIGELPRSLEGLPVGGPIGLVTGDPIRHLVVAGFGGHDRHDGCVGSDRFGDEALAEPRLAGSSSADQEGEAAQ